MICLITYAIVYNFGAKAFVLFCFQQNYWDCCSYSIYNTTEQDSIEWKHLIYVRRSVTLPDNMTVNRIYSTLAVLKVNRDSASAKSGCLWEGTSQLQDALGAVGPWKRRHPPPAGPSTYTLASFCTRASKSHTGRRSSGTCNKWRSVVRATGFASCQGQAFASCASASKPALNTSSFALNRYCTFLLQG
jgi:hypothetical protein